MLLEAEKYYSYIGVNIYHAHPIKTEHIAFIHL